MSWVLLLVDADASLSLQIWDQVRRPLQAVGRCLTGQHRRMRQDEARLVLPSAVSPSDTLENTEPRRDMLDCQLAEWMFLSMHTAEIQFCY